MIGNTTVKTLKRMKYRPMFLIVIEMPGGSLMCHTVAEQAFRQARFDGIYKTLFGMHKISIKYPHWLDVRAVRIEAHDFIVGTGATHAV